MSSSFIHDWLAYTTLKEQVVDGVSERPTKLDNRPFLGVQEKTKMFYLKEGLVLASDDAPGDFRLVNKQTYMKVRQPHDCARLEAGFLTRHFVLF